MSYTRQWIKSDTIKQQHANLAIEQTTAWLEIQGKFLLVSEDGRKWQFPGGSGEHGESAIQAIQRELYEETGQQMTEQDLVMVGYYLILNMETQDTFLQPRFYSSKLASYQGQFSSHHTNKEDEISAYKLADLDEIYSLFKWIKDSEELQAVLSAKTS